LVGLASLSSYEAMPDLARATPLPRRPTRAEIEAARDRTIEDVVAPDLRVLFCGINPGLYSGATGWHFARPGNRFWKVLHEAGFTDRLLHPSEQTLLPHFGLGITNLARRTTATADELTVEELRAGAERLHAVVRRWKPDWVAVVGISAFRIAFDARTAPVGRQDLTIEGTRVWVLPNPSGLNAHYQVPELVAAFRELRDAAFG
jgi:TDG/mug DNA glycosylase family protein